MLGNGCPWKGQCNQKKDKFMLKNYCNNDSGWRNCQHRPLNDGNNEVAKKQNTRHQEYKDIKLFWGITIFFIILWLTNELGYM